MLTIIDKSKDKRLVDQVIIAAYRKNASDIHIEPSPITKSTQIRFRLDGVCQEYMKVPNSMVRGIISRVKIMSNLDIAERRLPQDGKIKFSTGVSELPYRPRALPHAPPPPFAYPLNHYRPRTASPAQSSNLQTKYWGVARIK